MRATYRDLIDLLLLAELDPDLAKVAAACVEIFAQRATHPWPPRLTVEPSWHEQYATLAAQQGFAITDVHEATARVHAFIDALATGDRHGIDDQRS